MRRNVGNKASCTVLYNICSKFLENPQETHSTKPTVVLQTCIASHKLCRVLCPHARITYKVTGKSVGLFWYSQDIDFLVMM